MASSAVAEDKDYPGPFCLAAGIKLVDVQAESFERIPLQHIKNGLVLELNRYICCKNIPKGKIVEWIFQIHENCSNINESQVSRIKEKIRLRVITIAKIRDKLRTKKATRELHYLENAIFLENVSGNDSQSPTTSNDVVGSSTQNTCIAIQDAAQTQKADETLSESCAAVADVSKTRGGSQLCKCNREDLSLSFEIARKEKHLKTLEQKLNSIQLAVKTKQGKYNEYNVDRRDERGKKNYALSCSLNAKVTSLEKTKGELLAKVAELEQVIGEKDKIISQLKETQQNLEAQLENEKEKKRANQLSRSYFKSKGEGKLQVKQDNGLKQQIKEKNETISALEATLELVGDGQQMSVLSLGLKDDSGFSRQLRFCVLGLLGLEIAQAKIPLVMQWIFDSLCNTEIPRDQLPSRTSVQKMSDESHYIAKRFIAHELDKCDNWGLAKDGTSRKKAKLLDTSLTLSSGDCMSLGFTRVSRETGAAIAEVAKSALQELEDIHNDERDSDDTDNFLVASLEKLTFTMGDHASNEKLAHKILGEWRESVLKENASPEAEKSIHAFHCMAHVVLGFHSYIKKSLTDYENELISHIGRFGRDALPRFAFWKKEEAASRAIRTTADLFGPVGDHLGVRDQWESYCARSGIKSFIQNYRDNRFNNYFEIAAQVCMHREGFIQVLQKGEGKDPNGKKVAVLADLKCPVVTTILQGLGLMFVLITGPYWELTVGGKIPYLELYKYIQPAYRFLKDCSDDPSPLLNGICPFPQEFRVSSVAMHQSVSVLKHDDQEEIFHLVLKKAAASFVQTMDAQLKDFLDGGKYGQAPDPVELQRTQFSGVTNLPCEHHFGDLDSSQRRRPSASLFFHSTVQILKRNRKQIIQWINGMTCMTEEEQKKLWADARQKGRQLREKHQQQEKTEMEKIFEDMNKDPPKKRPRKRKKDAEDDTIDETDGSLDVTPPAVMEERRQHLKAQIGELEKELDIGKWVVVAFQDDWYPGIVRDHGKTPSEWMVDFGKHCDTVGEFLWPDGKDKQLVQAVFIIAVGFKPDSRKRGRKFVYIVPNVDEVIGMYNEYAGMFFDYE